MTALFLVLAAGASASAVLLVGEAISAAAAAAGVKSKPQKRYIIILCCSALFFLSEFLRCRNLLLVGLESGDALGTANNVKISRKRFPSLPSVSQVEGF